MTKSPAITEDKIKEVFEYLRSIAKDGKVTGPGARAAQNLDLGVTASQMTKVLEQLEAEGLIERYGKAGGSYCVIKA